MKKRIFSFVMAWGMLLGLFSACEQSGSTPSSQATPASGESAVQSAAAPSAENTIAWPENPVQIIVGANAGDGIDTAARLIGKYMENI